MSDHDNTATSSQAFRPQSPLGIRWEIETLKHEINRLNRVMRNPLLSEDERVIAKSQLRFYSESLSETEVN